MPYLGIVEKNAPRATLINFSNPVSVACNAIARYSSMDFIGLCYHSTKLRRDFAVLLGTPPDDLEIFSFGLNHFSWITDARVKGKSCFKELVDAIARLKIKDYNYDCIQTFNAVPIGHAYSMYHRGSRYLAPEKGKRGNLEDIAYRFFVSKSVYTRHFINRQNRLLKAYAKKDLAVLDDLRRKAPWYESCIVPFLADLMQTSKSIEYLLTIRGADNLGRVRAYEVPCTVRNSTVDRKKAAGAVPEFVIDAVQNIAASEELMIEAIMKRSAALGMQAMVIHPHVYSQECARKFCDFYLGRT
jgi:alpha-galactosidase